jgi:hypothetical protein
VLGLALNACLEPNGHYDERAQISELVSTARELWRTLPEIEDDLEQRVLSRATFRLLHLADILAVTSGA